MISDLKITFYRHLTEYLIVGKSDGKKKHKTRKRLNNTVQWKCQNKTKNKTISSKSRCVFIPVSEFVVWKTCRGTFRLIKPFWTSKCQVFTQKNSDMITTPKDYCYRYLRKKNVITSSWIFPILSTITAMQIWYQNEDKVNVKKIWRTCSEEAWFSYKGVTLANFARYDSYTHHAHK